MTVKIPRGKPHWVIHRAGDRKQTYTRLLESEATAYALFNALKLSSPGLQLEVTKYGTNGKPETTYEF